MVLRHNKLRDVFYDFCQRACLGPRLEMSCRGGGGGGDPILNPAQQMFLFLTGTLASRLPLTCPSRLRYNQVFC